MLDLYKAPYIEVALERTKIGDVWGVGAAWEKKLLERDIKTALQFKYCNTKWVKKVLTIKGTRTLYELNGFRCFDLEITPPPKKSIICSRSFGETVSEFNELYYAVSCFLATAVSKMRSENLAARSLTVFIGSNRFRENYYGKSQTYRSAYPSNNLFELQAWAGELMEKIFAAGVDYKKAGVELGGLIPREGVTRRLYPELQIDPKREKLNQVVDDINRKFGKDTIRLTVANKGKWESKAEHMSPRYTTRLNEIVRIY